MRTADTIEAQGSVKTPKTSAKKSGKPRNPRSLANLVAPWKPGQSGNPGGKPKDDMAREIAQAIFSNNPELIYKAFSRTLKKGNAYAFQVLSDRAYGKLKETKEVTHRYEDVPDADLQQRVDDLIRDLGLAKQVDDAAATAGSEAGTTASGKPA